MKRRTLLISLALMTLVACGVSWQTLSEAGFTVQMPGKPNDQTQTAPTAVGPITVHLYSVEAKGEAFIVGYSDYPESAVKDVNPEQLLKNAHDSAIKGINGKVTSERSITLNGKPGHESIGDASMPQEGTFTARVYLDGPRLYQVLYVRPKGTAVSENGQKFLDSFQLTGNK